MKAIEKYSSIPEEVKEKIMLGLLTGKLRNRAEAARIHQIAYSTLRRFVEDELRKLGMESFFDVQYLNTADFDFLAEEFTFQYREGLVCWKIIGKTKKESEEVWVLIPLKKKQAGIKHFINEVESLHQGVPFVP